MSDDETVSALGGASSARSGKPQTRRVASVWTTMHSRAVELLIVFVGVYAAFLLNRLDSERHDAKRRTQIVGALEREVSENVDELKHDIAGAESELSDFDRQLAAGEMPRLGISYTNSGYSATDDAALLQAGGLDLLDMQTLELMRKVNTMERELIAATHNQFEVSLTELANHQNADFYDPSTRQLRPQYQWFPVILRNVVRDAKTLQAAEESLLTHLRSTHSAGTRAQL